MIIDIITLFPKIFDSYFNESILKRAQDKKLVKIRIHNIRDFTKGKHKLLAETSSHLAPRKAKPRAVADDKPYGGGAGMVQMAEPILHAVQRVKSKSRNPKSKTKIVILSAKGKQFNQKLAQKWSKLDQLILISGRYEGIDERVRLALKAEEISLGPYVLTDGDLGAMAIISAIIRLVPGAIKSESLNEESYVVLRSDLRTNLRMNTLEYPHYTRPEVFIYKGKKYKVPKVLLSGHHQKIAEWRKKHQKIVEK